MDGEKKNQWYGLKPKWVPEWVSITFVAFVIFIVGMLFFGESSYIKSNQYTQEINRLKQQIKENKDTAQVYVRKVNELNTDKETLERIAREKYNMKRRDEDVYNTEIK